MKLHKRERSPTETESLLSWIFCCKACGNILYQLKAENTSDSASATPQWVVDAWEACRADPSAYTMEDITFDIVFKNGTVLKDIIYQPFIGNGYIAGMQELTLEQNITLKELLR